MAVSARIVVARAFNATVSDHPGQRAAYVFQRPGSGWANATETAKLTASDGALGDEFGEAVAASATTIVAGAPAASENGNFAGAAYVFSGPAPTTTRVVCTPSTLAPGDATACTATVTDTASGGQSTPTGTVSFTSSGTGRFFGSPSSLSGSGASATCGVFFTSFARGGQGITARYSGDGSHNASAGSTMVLVALPASTAGCSLSGHGRITAANGDRASFRARVSANPPSGAAFYRDNGPADPFRLRSTTVDALTCGSDASTASVFGTATNTRGGSVAYRIDVQLSAWRHGSDTFRIRLSNGYDSGARQIVRGDVDIRIGDERHGHHDPGADRQDPAAGPDGG